MKNDSVKKTKQTNLNLGVNDQCMSRSMFMSRRQSRRLEKARSPP